MTNFGKQTNQAVRPFFKMLAGIVGLLALLSIIPPLIGSDGSLRSLVRLIPEVGFALTFLYFSLSRREKSGQGSQAYGSPDRSLTRGEIIVAFSVLAGLLAFIIYEVATK
jgi:hypothetical protein